MRTRSARVLAAALLTALALTGCSDDGDDGTATDTSGEETPSPTASPTVGTYPAYAPEDYSFTLTVSCFCPDAGVPIRVTVAGGKVAEAVYGEKGPGHAAGDPVQQLRAVTIDGIIDELNAATDAERVEVEWPAGQDYPSEVYIDQSARISDEEIGYTIADVQVG
jgi:hypothetical protein